MTCPICGKPVEIIDKHRLQMGKICVNKNCPEYGKYYLVDEKSTNK